MDAKGVARGIPNPPTVARHAANADNAAGLETRPTAASGAASLLQPRGPAAEGDVQLFPALVGEHRLGGLEAEAIGFAAVAEFAIELPQQALLLQVQAEVPGLGVV